MFEENISIMAKRTIVKRPLTKKKATKGTGKKMDEDSVQHDWQSMFVLAGHWQSDLKFFRDELAFFQKLIDKYFVWLIEEKNIGDTRRFASALTTLERRRSSLEEDVSRHLVRLGNLTQNPFVQNGQESRDQHALLEKSSADFAKAFRDLKKQVFQLTEHVIESEKTRHLLGN
jgi:hypothetical protein